MPADLSPLLGDYSLAILPDEEFVPLFRKHRPQVFADAFEVRPGFLPEAEKSAQRALAERMGSLYRLHVGLYRAGEFVGWSTGVQADAERYYMINTGILPGHQGKGLYTALLPRILEKLRIQGFQAAYSRHVATNSRVLVPKLKAGFVISGFELSDTFGTLVHLTYLFNPTRRKLLDFRAGQRAPDAELRGLLGL